MQKNRLFTRNHRGLPVRFYYGVKPALPRRVQVFLRSRWVLRTCNRYTHIWPIDVGTSKPPPAWSGWPEGNQFALVLTHDVEGERGLERCLQLAALEEELGFRSSFNFVAKGYEDSPELRGELVRRGFEIGVHGLVHDGRLFDSEKDFRRRAREINRYLADWNAVGFRAPAMQRRFEWMHVINMEYDSSSFDTDPFEPQPDGVGTIFPFFVTHSSSNSRFVELPYTLPQDFLLYVLMKRQNIDIWKNKLDWIAQVGGMVLLITHPDYMCFENRRPGREEYPSGLYTEFLTYIRETYEGRYWHVLPREMGRFWAARSEGAESHG